MIHMLVFLASGAYVGSHTANSWTVTILAARFLFILSLILLLSVGLHAAYEAPARSWLRGLRRKGWVPAACAPLAILIAASASALAARQVMGHRSANALTVVEATYGGNCGAPRGNVTGDVRQMCDGLDACDYVVDVAHLGDVVPTCGKSFDVRYSCPGKGLRTQSLPGEAGFRSIARLRCTESIPGEAK